MNDNTLLVLCSLSLITSTSTLVLAVLVVKKGKKEIDEAKQVIKTKQHRLQEFLLKELNA